MDTNHIINVIKNYDVISFDVFDTLLVRPYVRPTDLFFHMARCFRCPSFARARISAERSARQNTTKFDVTLDDIYDEIDDNFRELKQSELDWEYMVLRPNPDMCAVWNAARNMGKKIIIASDMYLPTDFISNVLRKNGFDGFDNIYVSCDINKTKHAGTMFDAIIRDTGMPPKKILHIGDNKLSDYDMPRRHGMSAIRIVPIINRYMKSNARIAHFWKSQNGDIGASVLVSMMALHSHTVNKSTNYWYRLGWMYAGPAIYGYTRWLESIARIENLDTLLFVARDGYTLQRVFTMFNHDIETKYVYAPRLLNLICRLEYRTDASSVAIAQQRAIIEHYCLENKKLATAYHQYDFTKNTMADFIESNIELFKSLAADNFLRYKAYINEYILNSDNHNVGIVDTRTENYSAQNLITAAIGDSGCATGLYWWARPMHNSRHFSFFDSHANTPPESVYKWNLMEFLMTSPEYPIHGIAPDFTPIYKETISDDEKFIRRIYPDISDGATDFAKYVLDMFDGHDIYLTYDCVVRWVNCFMLYPGKDDFKYMRQIRTTCNPNSDYYTGLLRDEIPFSYRVRHPIQYYKKIKSFIWNTSGEKIVLNLVHIVQLRMHGIGRIELCILPRVQRNIFCVSIKFGSHIKYSLRIGRDD